MTLYDVFNGDADGICALQQWRLTTPAESVLITGVKRDISLLKQVQASAEDRIAVFDIALEKNSEALESALAAGAEVIYFDHHYPGEIPNHGNFTSNINTSADVCTSLLVNQYLNGAHAHWAVVGAFGDNLANSAYQLAKEIGLADSHVAQLKVLGECINYNGYGASLDDLHITPQALSLAIRPYADPLDFVAQSPHYKTLLEGYQKDMAQAVALEAIEQDDSVAIFSLPDQPWARRVSGVYANQLATESPNRAHAMLTIKSNGNYLVSVRAPLNRKEGADKLCLQFPTGGGRKAAAGINDLPADQLDQFICKFREAYAC